jgi:hypothetical protein
MKFLFQVITIAVVAFILELFMPWWCIAVAAFAGGFALKTKANFFAGLLAIALLWFIKAILIEASATAPLTERVAAIFTLSKPMLILVTVLLGGLLGGFAAMTGAALKKSDKMHGTLH